MGAHAAREALDDAGLAARDIDLILNASGTPEQALPDTAPFIHKELGLGPSGIPAMSVGAACLSFLAAFDVAASLLATERYRQVLIVSTEVSSVGLDPSDRETGPLFGDGAAAIVVARPEKGDPACLHAARFETYSEGAALTGIPGCGTRRPPGHPDTNLSDSLFRMNGPALLRVAVRHGRPFLKRFAHDLAGLSFCDALLIPHQPSRAGMGLYEPLGFPPGRTVVTLTELGNCVAASMPLSLYEAVRSGRLARGQRAMLLGTGAGVSFGAGLLTY
jgi:3-oxoacyl-[acyl-carrier-protein] synthase III